MDPLFSCAAVWQAHQNYSDLTNMNAMPQPARCITCSPVQSAKKDLRQNLARAAQSGIAHIEGTNPLLILAGQGPFCPGRKKIRLGEKGTRESPSRRQAKRDRPATNPLSHPPSHTTSNHVVDSERAMLRQEEDGHRRRPLQG